MTHIWKRWKCYSSIIEFRYDDCDNYAPFSVVRIGTSDGKEDLLFESKYFPDAYEFAKKTAEFEGGYL